MGEVTISVSSDGEISIQLNPTPNIPPEYQLFISHHTKEFNTNNQTNITTNLYSKQFQHPDEECFSRCSGVLWNLKRCSVPLKFRKSKDHNLHKNQMEK
jgi:hypothetical protein